MSYDKFLVIFVKMQLYISNLHLWILVNFVQLNTAIILDVASYNIHKSEMNLLNNEFSSWPRKKASVDHPYCRIQRLEGSFDSLIL